MQIWRAAKSLFERLRSSWRLFWWGRCSKCGRINDDWLWMHRGWCHACGEEHWRLVQIEEFPSWMAQRRREEDEIYARLFHSLLAKARGEQTQAVQRDDSPEGSPGSKG